LAKSARFRTSSSRKPIRQPSTTLAGVAGSFFIGMDTFIGAVYLAGGLGEGENSALYLFVGRPN